jgi:hypothetical protein
MSFVRFQPCTFYRWYRGNIKLISEGNAIQAERSFASRVEVSARPWPSITSPVTCRSLVESDAGKMVTVLLAGTWLWDSVMNTWGAKDWMQW